MRNPNYRLNEYIRQSDFKNSWLLSLNFSRQLNEYTEDNINKLSYNQFINFYKSIIGQYQGELNYPFKNNYKFVRIWIDFNNLIKKSNNKDNFIKYTNQLYLTSYKNNL